MTPENKAYRLPDYYDKTEESNNWKILEMQHQDTELLNEEIELVRTASDVSKATGKALDVWGMIEEIDRNGLSDEAYRGQILLKIARDMAQVDFTSWYRLILDTFSATQDEIIISGTGNPYEYQFDLFPLRVLTEAGLNINTATTLIEATLPITGELAEICYSSDIPVQITAYVGTALTQSSMFVLGKAELLEKQYEIVQITAYVGTALTQSSMFVLGKAEMV